MSDQPVVLGRTLRTFAFAQVAAILISIALVLSGVDLGSGTNMMGSLAAALFAAQGFVKTYGRAPTSEERSRLAWFSLALACAISFLFVALVAALAPPAEVAMYVEAFRKLPTAMIVFIVIFILGLYLALYHLAYGPLARMLEKTFAVKRS